MDSIFDQMLARYDITTNSDKLNATHEVMQQVTLSGLYRAGFFAKAAFYGGSCLRIFHNLPRFSEDMDFSLLGKDESFSIENYFSAIENEFQALGRQVQISKKVKKKESQIESAFLKDNTDIANVAYQTEPSVKIKIEVDKDPPLNFNIENKLLLLPFSFMTTCFDIPGLFAGKVHAFLYRNWKNRVKGRDWYDLEWYVRNNYTLDFNHLKARVLQNGYRGQEEFTPELAIELMKDRIHKTNISRVLDDVKPFVASPDGLDIWSTEYFIQIVDMIRFS